MKEVTENTYFTEAHKNTQLRHKTFTIYLMYIPLSSIF